jgi:hypothetical protein
MACPLLRIDRLGNDQMVHQRSSAPPQQPVGSRRQRCDQRNRRQHSGADKPAISCQLRSTGFPLP